MTFDGGEWGQDGAVERSNDSRVVAASVVGSLDLLVLQKVMTTLAARHSALRTAFRWEEGRAVPVVAESVTPSWAAVDLSGLPEGEREEALRAWVSAQVEEGFELARAPLWRYGVVRREEQYNVVVVIVHRRIADAASRMLLLKAVRMLYQQVEQRGEADPPRGAERAMPPLEAVRGWDPWKTEWRRVFGRPLPRRAAVAEPSPGQRARWVGTPVPELDGVQVGALAAVARLSSVRQGTQADGVVAAAVLALGATVSQAVLVGVAEPYRDGPGMDRMIGTRSDFLPVLVALDGELSFLAVIGRVWEARRHARGWAGPLGQMRSVLDEGRGGREPFWVAVEFVPRWAVEGQVLSPGARFGTRIKPRSVGVQDGAVRWVDGPVSSAVPVIVEVGVTPEGRLAGCVWALEALFSADQRRQMAEQFSAVLAAGIAAPRAVVQAAKGRGGPGAV